jgi:hypothetical protein
MIKTSPNGMKPTSLPRLEFESCIAIVDRYDRKGALSIRLPADAKW